MTTKTWEERLVNAIDRRRAEQARIDAEIEAQAQGLDLGPSRSGTCIAAPVAGTAIRRYS